MANGIYRGTILCFEGSWMSGLGYLIIQDSDTGKLMRVPCENAETVRQLERCFGNVIGNAHDVKQRGGHVGKEIYWSYDDMGLILGGFTPVEEASVGIIERYNAPEGGVSD